MKNLKQTIVSWRLLGSLLSLMILSIVFVSCKEDLPSEIDSSDKFSQIEAIRIVNAGPSGNQVLEGEINHNTKEIRFPRIDTLTNFDDLRFEIVGPAGAKLEKESYKVEFQPGQSSRSLVLKVVNEPRSTEYLAMIRLDIPVFGAEFSKAVVYSQLGYPSFTGLATRGTGFDGEHVLVIDRGALGPHLVSVADVKNGVVTRTPLNMTNVTGGTYTVNMGAQIKGHTYVANLSTSQAQNIKIYHWTDPSAPAEVIGDINVALIPGAGARHGDMASVNLDANGNGYIFFISNNAAPAPVIRLKVTNWTTISEPIAFTVPVSYGQWSSYLRIEESDEYLLTSNIQPISLVNMNGLAAHKFLNSTVTLQGSDARIFHFAGERYLLQITVARTTNETTVLQVYDITRGETIKEALTLFEASVDRAPVYSLPMSSVPNAAPGSQTGYHIIKDAEGNDDVLMLYGAASDVGFVVIEIPKKRQDD